MVVEKRKAFSLLELIISIIIIAITSVSIPIIISTTSNANKKGVAQEALLNARTFLKVVTSSAFTCDYIIDNPYSMLPRFSVDGTGPNLRPNKRLEVNFFEGNKATGLKPYNFYTKYGLNDAGRRIFYPYLKTKSEKNPACNSTLCESSTDSQRRCIQDFVNAYNTTSTMTYNSSDTRDFISPYKFKLSSSHEHNPFKNKDGFEEPVFEIKHVVVHMQEPMRMKLFAIVTNIGDSPILQTRVWK